MRTYIDGVWWYRFRWLVYWICRIFVPECVWKQWLVQQRKRSLEAFKKRRVDRSHKSIRELLWLRWPRSDQDQVINMLTGLVRKEPTE